MAIDIEGILGRETHDLLTHKPKVPRDHLHLPGPDFVDRVWTISDRSPRVLRNIQTLFSHGRLAGTGYLSILPVDQGIEHSGGASSGDDDLKDVVRTAVINKRAGGMGLISGRKAFQRPTHEGIELLHAIQDVYLADEVTVA
jgi:fructose-bisphosphate aldolase, class I